MPVVTHYTGYMYGWKMAVKRLLDIVISAFLLVILSPLALITAIAIKIDSPGPVHFVQERVGLNKRKFRLYKFRTMVDGADKKQVNLEELNEVSGPVFKIKNDPRITPVGKILAKNQHRRTTPAIQCLKGRYEPGWPAAPAGAGLQRVQRGLAASAVQRAAGDHLPVAGERPEQYVIRALDEAGYGIYRYLVFAARPENFAADGSGCFARFRGGVKEV